MTALICGVMHSFRIQYLRLSSKSGSVEAISLFCFHFYGFKIYMIRRGHGKPV